MVVSFSCPNTSSSEMNDPFFFGDNGEEIDPRVKLWKDKRIYAFIYCGINLVLFIFTINLSFYQSLLYKYLSLDFGEINNSEITRKASIKIGKNNYDIEVKPNKDIYLKDRRENERFIFKEIIYDNNTYYLKFNNMGIKDQLGWIEYNYPLVNAGFTHLIFCFKSLVYIYLPSMIVFPIFHYKDDIWYKYIVYLIDLGAKPYLYDCVRKIGDLQGLLYYLIKYIFLVLAILLLFPIFRWAFYGGFSNINHLWIVLFISIVFNLIILAFMILSFLTFAYNLINMLLFMYELPFVCNLIFPKLYAFIILYFFIFIFILVLFLYSIGFSRYINSVRKETKKLENEKLGSEDVFKVKTIENENFILEAVNSDSIPKNLFYSKKK
jgi:hypothetical protein